MSADPAEDMRSRLQADLRAALKARAAPDVAVLRVLIAAIDNAGAVLLEPGVGAGQTEVERRRLSQADVRALLRREQAALEGAADELVRVGRPAEAERSRREAAIAGRYLD